jgi:hypothetical protein
MVDEKQQEQTPFASAATKAPKSPEDAKKSGEGTVTMSFPRPVRLTTRNGVVDFPAGVIEVPQHLADEPYLKLSGAKKQESKPGWLSKVKKNGGTPGVMGDKDLHFMQASGVPVTELSGAQGFYDSLDPDAQEEYREDVAKWEDTQDQAARQTQVQNYESGAREAAPPNQEGAEPGQPPKSPAELAGESKPKGKSKGKARTADNEEEEDEEEEEEEDTTSAKSFHGLRRKKNK